MKKGTLLSSLLTFEVLDTLYIYQQYGNLNEHREAIMQDFWNQRFSGDDYAYGIEPNRYFKRNIDTLKSGSLLLPGEGEGRNAVYAAKQGWNVTAVDFSVAAQVKANKLAVDHNVEINYVLKTLDDAVLEEESFDVAAIIYLQLEQDKIERLFDKVFKSLKPGGTIIFECFSEKQLGKASGGPKTIARLYTIPQIRALLEPASEVTYLQEEEISLKEGEYRSGTAMVIRALAKK